MGSYLKIIIWEEPLSSLLGYFRIVAPPPPWFMRVPSVRGLGGKGKRVDYGASAWKGRLLPPSLWYAKSLRPRIWL